MNEFEEMNRKSMILTVIMLRKNIPNKPLLKGG